MRAQPETIAAVASPPGRAHTGIVRLSGPRTLDALGQICAGRLPTSAGAHHVRLALPPGELPALLLLWRAPRSYTAEDSAELLIPGNPLLLRRVLEALFATKLVEPAPPGAFTERAFVAGKLTLTEAEGVAATIAAETEAQLDSARRLLAGDVGRRCAAWGESLAHLLALVEAGIDFTDQEDVVPIAPSALAERVRTLRDALHDFTGGAPARALDRGAPVVMLVGPPSAGKSTLFNALLGRPRAAVAEAPGTTRDALAEPLDLAPELPAAGTVEIVDLAGIDEEGMTTGLDGAAQALAREHADRADVLVHCDPAGDYALGLPSRTPTLRVRTKADRAAALTADALPVCALDGTGLPQLRRRIAELAFGTVRGDLAVAPRHRAGATAAVRALDEALDLIDPAAHALADPELVAGALREALDALRELAGEHTPDDVIGLVFASFCVGK